MTGIRRSTYRLVTLAPGSGHTVLSDGLFYTETVEGEKLADWVTKLITGRPVGDVHCKECIAE